MSAIEACGTVHLGGWKWWMETRGLVMQDKGGVKNIADLRAKTTWKTDHGAMWKLQNDLKLGLSKSKAVKKKKEIRVIIILARAGIYLQDCKCLCRNRRQVDSWGVEVRAVLDVHRQADWVNSNSRSSSSQLSWLPRDSCTANWESGIMTFYSKRLWAGVTLDLGKCGMQKEMSWQQRKSGDINFFVTVFQKLVK